MRFNNSPPRTSHDVNVNTEREPVSSSTENTISSRVGFMDFWWCTEVFKPPSVITMLIYAYFRLADLSALTNCTCDTTELCIAPVSYSSDENIRLSHTLPLSHSLSLVQTYTHTHAHTLLFERYWCTICALCVLFEHKFFCYFNNHLNNHVFFFLNIFYARKPFAVVVRSDLAIRNFNDHS